jgi:formylglycine-generating enzyme required for sulfatase activity
MPDTGLRPVARSAAGFEVLERTKDGALMVRVPAGPYPQRPYEPDGATATPVPVEVGTFLIDVTEVTNAQVLTFLREVLPEGPKAQGPPLVVADPLDFVTTLAETGDVGLVRPVLPWTLRPGRARHPATALTGHGAVAYATWVGGRLPTRAEWEKAAGGTQARLYPWGDEAPDAAHARFGRPAALGTLPVGSHAAGASPYGLLDMAGNVYERVSAAPGQAPTMIKGGSWLSPHPLNLRVLDMCMQSMDVAERSVGLRVVLDDVAGVTVPLPEAAPRLHLETDWMDAVDRAQRERKPLFLALHYDTCGQCDRTRAQLFTDPRFVAWCNEHLVVVVGMDPGDAVRDPHPVGPDGACPLLPGLDCWQHMALFRQGLGVVGSFRISPGHFVLHPDRIHPGAGEAAVLVGEAAFGKWGHDVEGHLEAFASAVRALRAGDAEHPPAPPDDDADGEPDDD